MLSSRRHPPFTILKKASTPPLARGRVGEALRKGLPLTKSSTSARIDFSQQISWGNFRAP